MTLEGANNFKENDSNTIYTMNSNQTGQYCVVIPKNTDTKINMLVDLNMKKSFDSLVNNSIDKDTLIKEISDEYDKIVGKYPNSVLVLPMMNTDELSNSIISNDSQKILGETKKIGSITSEIYQKLVNAGIDKGNIDQKIIIVEKTDMDNKFVKWLEDQMPNFVDGVNYDELGGSDNEVASDINPFTGEHNQAVEDVFGSANDDKKETEAVSDVLDNSSVDELNVDENKNETNLDGVDIVPEDGQPVSESQPTDDTAIISPQPISATKLDTTQTLPTVEEKTEENSLAEPVNNTDDEKVVSEVDKKSGGFANLLILMVVLVLVTAASIELGKILYNTFGG